jgi:hypothetical protein
MKSGNTERKSRRDSDPKAKYPKDFTGNRQKASKGKKKSAKAEEFFDENGNKYDWRELMNAGNPTLKKNKKK